MFIILGQVMLNNKSCEEICGVDHKFEDNQRKCCKTQQYQVDQDCVPKDQCGPWGALSQAGLYMVGIPCIIACCIGAASRKRETTYTTVEPKTKKYIIVEVDDWGIFILIWNKLSKNYDISN